MTINLGSIVSLYNKVPGPVKHWVGAAAVTYIGLNYGPQAQRIAECVLSVN